MRNVSTWIGGFLHAPLPAQAGETVAYTLYSPGLFTVIDNVTGVAFSVASRTFLAGGTWCSFIGGGNDHRQRYGRRQNSQAVEIWCSYIETAGLCLHKAGANASRGGGGNFLDEDKHTTGWPLFTFLPSFLVLYTLPSAIETYTPGITWPARHCVTQQSGQEMAR